MTPYHITTPDAAEILGCPDLARLLKPFMRGPQSVSAVAKMQCVSVESLHHRVQRLHRAGLAQSAKARGPRRYGLILGLTPLSRPVD